MGSPVTPDRTPNVVIVVLDTARADFVARVPLEGSGFEGVRTLKRESLQFPRAISPSTWTYPSHASLFTGRYPWENHALLTELAPLSPEIPHLARLLRNGGFRTMALSSNPVVSSWTGLTAPFETARWSQWWHLFLRIAAWAGPTGPNVGDPTRASPKRALPSDLFVIAKRLLLRHPGAASLVSTLISRATGASSLQRDSVDSWIESALRSDIVSTPRETPIFAFVNLMEAHEPYLPSHRVDDEEGRSARLCRQDREAFLADRWTITPREIRSLRAFYRDGIRTSLLRVSTIVQTLMDAGRWNNTIVVLTGDHGQEFCEEGGLFHGTYPGDAQVCVPLWLRVPDGTLSGGVARGAASLIDVLPTVLNMVGSSLPTGCTGRDLRSLADKTRPDPVFSHSEQLPDDDGFRMRYGSQWIGLNRFWVAARTEDRGIVLDTHRGITFRAGRGRPPAAPGRRPDSMPSDEADDLRGTLKPVDQAIRRILNESLPDSTEERLRSWGYF